MTGLLVRKELRLAASPLTYLFILFGAMTLLPGYPILAGAFFIGFGIFQSFQAGREENDITYSALLPVAKADVVRGKFRFCLIVEAAGLGLIGVFTLLRMCVWQNAAVYVENPLMPANLVFLGFVLLIFGLFNLLFVAGFFKTAYSLAKPFLAFVIASGLVVALAETLHHLSGLAALGALGFESLGVQLAFLGAGAAIAALLTAMAIRLSVRRFEAIDL